MELVKCPRCQGKGSKEVFAYQGEGCGLEDFPCPQCKGQGQIAAEMIYWIKEGERLKDWIEMSGSTLFDLAQTWQCAVVEISDWMMGRARMPAPVRVAIETNNSVLCSEAENLG